MSYNQQPYDKINSYIGSETSGKISLIRTNKIGVLRYLFFVFDVNSVNNVNDVKLIVSPMGGN